MEDVWFTLTHIDGGEVNVIASDIVAFGPRSKNPTTQEVPRGTKIIIKGGYSLVVEEYTGVIKDLILKVYSQEPAYDGCRPGFYKP